MGQFDEIRAKLEQTKALRAQQFDTGFWSSAANHVGKNKGSFDLESNKINLSGSSLPSKEEMWNKYVKFASNKGINPNYQNFNQNYFNLKSAENKQSIKVLNDAKLLGIKDDTIRRQIKNNPEMKERIMQLVQSGNIEDVEQLIPLLQKKQTFWSYFGDLKNKVSDLPNTNPLAFLAGSAGAASLAGVAGYKGIEKARNMLKGKKTTGTKSTKASPKKYITKAKIDSEFRKYQQEYKGDRANRLRKRDFEKKYRAEQKAVPKATPKATPKKSFNIKGGVRNIATMLAIQKAIELLHNNSEE